MRPRVTDRTSDRFLVLSALLEEGQVLGKTMDGEKCKSGIQDYLLFMHRTCSNRANQPATPPGTWLCGRRGWGWGRDPAPSFQRPLRRSLFLTRRELTRGNSRRKEGKIRTKRNSDDGPSFRGDRPIYCFYISQNRPLLDDKLRSRPLLKHFSRWREDELARISSSSYRFGVRGSGSLRSSQIEENSGDCYAKRTSKRNRT